MRLERLNLTKNCLVYNLGLIEYNEALQIQEKLLELRKAAAIPDVLLLLEHKSVFTFGRSGHVENVLVPAEKLAQEGISIVPADRGGDITYHGPGQIVGYPIINLTEHGLNVHEYVWSLEELVIRTLEDCGIRGERVTGKRGVWVGEEKICAVGVRISRWVTMHGFALNVSPDLKYFSYIVPCGLQGVVTTSISRLLGHEIALESVEDRIKKNFSVLFKTNLEDREGIRRWLDTLSLNGSTATLPTRQR
jgi:lipoyl(octanoyl) transferase